MKAFREILKRSQHVVVLSGAGISAESGVPTFRGAGGYWRRWQAQELATPESFSRNPSLVWEFYNYRREVMRTKTPNKAHEAIAALEEGFEKEGKGRKVTIITQNIDRLHHQAKSKNIVELHGSLFHTRCTACNHVEENRKSPLCPALEGKGAPDPKTPDAQIPVEDLPRCEQCGGLLRPHVVWFHEPLFPDVLKAVDKILNECDLCLVV
jgi:NAD-dependent deacetylase sirtuin 5